MPNFDKFDEKNCLRELNNLEGGVCDAEPMPPPGTGNGHDPRCDDPAFAAANPGLCGDDGDGDGNDPRCEDPAFAAANPDLCENFQRLIIKPDMAELCQMGTTQFKAFLVSSSGEQELATAIWKTSNLNVAIIGGASGNATAVGDGEATISATWQMLSAQSHVTVKSDCCDDTAVGMLLAIDNSKSMSQSFSPSYGTKLAFAKSAGRRFAEEVNPQKDSVGLLIFSESIDLDEELTSDTLLVKNAITLIPGTAKDTSILNMLMGGTQHLDAAPGLTNRVLVVISDGQSVPPEDLAAIYQTAYNFKQSGGTIIVLGIRAHGAGFALLSNIASQGFFINAHGTTAVASLELFSGVKGYVCAGNCNPPGDVIVPRARLNYTGFINWDVTEGVVDLIGGDSPYELFDLIPGNGLYVDLVGSSSPWLGRIRTKVAIPVVTTESYRIKYSLAGNQRADVIEGWSVHVLVRDEVNNINQFNHTQAMAEPFAGFVQFANTFTPSANGDVFIEFAQASRPDADPSHPSFGNLLDNVILERVSDNAVLFSDTFDGENPTYIPPRCGPATIGDHVGEYGTDCYGAPCLSEPVPEQVQDPAPQADLENNAP